MPDAARAYRDVVQQLGNARELLKDELLRDAEFTEARALVFEFLGGRVPVKTRADGSAVLTLRLDPSPILYACESKAYNLVAGGMFGSIHVG